MRMWNQQSEPNCKELSFYSINPPKIEHKSGRTDETWQRVKALRRLATGMSAPIANGFAKKNTHRRWELKGTIIHYWILFWKPFEEFKEGFVNILSEFESMWDCHPILIDGAKHKSDWTWSNRCPIYHETFGVLQKAKGFDHVKLEKFLATDLIDQKPTN